jgi:hypothetical protein
LRRKHFEREVDHDHDPEMHQVNSGMDGYWCQDRGQSPMNMATTKSRALIPRWKANEDEKISRNHSPMASGNPERPIRILKRDAAENDNRQQLHPEGFPGGFQQRTPT